MDTCFVYSHSVSGKNFIGRKNDISSIGNMLWQGENVALYGPPKCGLTSLLQQVFLQLKTTGRDVTAIEVPMTSVRSLGDFVVTAGDSIIKAAATTPDDYAAIISSCLAGTHLTFDPARFRASGQVLALEAEADMEDAAAVMRMPQRLAQDKGLRICAVLEDFYNITFIDDYERLLKAFEDVVRETTGIGGCTFVFAGSMLNAMKYLFEVKKYFWKLAECYTPSPIDEKDIIEHITRTLLLSGKVADNELLLGVCKLFRNDIWYINHFMAICDHLSKGYIMEPVLVEALDCILSLHRPRFKAAMYSLTTFQVSLLKAILDGHTKFSTADVIESYALNSSANVKRVKDALVKKEIISFDHRGEPYVIDPLFEYWVRKEFWGQKVAL